MPQPTYFKRYRMELDLRLPRPFVELPSGFRLASWDANLFEDHALTKFRSFVGEPDTQVLPSLGHLSGCRELMYAIAGNPGFCPGATWLATKGSESVGTVQGLLTSRYYGGIQNLGVRPEYRGLGIGRVLLLRALAGLARAGARRAYLEVTARNDAAVRMYRELGFRFHKTIYREIRTGANAEAPNADPVGVGLSRNR